MRIVKSADKVSVETCSRSYVYDGDDDDLVGVHVELVGVVHCARAEYFAKLATDGRTTLYESLVDASLVDDRGRLRVPIGATPDAVRLARSTGLTAQSDALGRVAYDAGWTIADLDRGALPPADGVPEVFRLLLRGRQPPSRPDEAIGKAAARAACALAPCPELALALVDWSWSPPRDARFLDDVALRAAATALVGRDASVLARLSLLRSLARAQRTDDLLAKRNDEAIKWLLRSALTDRRQVRIVYGAAHMRDLNTKLCALGFRPQDARDWTPAFDVPLQPPRRDAATLVPLLLFFVAFLSLDAADYALSFVDVVQSGFSPPVFDLSLYFLRHAALYYAITKLIVV